MSQITLYVPQMDELWFRKQLLEDPETMRYNKGYELASPYYHKDSGCIDFPKDSWYAWSKRFLNQEPEQLIFNVWRIKHSWAKSICIKMMMVIGMIWGSSCMHNIAIKGTR